MLPLRKMAENFGLVRKSLRPKLGRKSYFTPEGKVALMFLKMYTGLSCPKLMEQLNGRRMLVSSDAALDGKLFVQFIALILIEYIAKRIPIIALK